jgi:hypothetical protein
LDADTGVEKDSELSEERNDDERVAKEVRKQSIMVVIKARREK